MTNHRRGFTLIELMTVVAIVSIISAMAMAAYGAIGTRSAPQNAAHDLFSAFSKAKAIAQERQSDVWVIIYPDINTAGTAGAGGGAYFIYDDADGNFLSGGTMTYAAFNPPGAVTPGERDRLIEANYLDRYSGKNVLFGNVTSTAFGGPFTSVTVGTKGCSFCTTAAKIRGAVVFSADGTARFVDAAGASAAARTGGVALRARQSDKIGSLIGIARATGFVATYR